jgi:hypothetical protein
VSHEFDDGFEVQHLVLAAMASRCALLDGAYARDSPRRANSR